MLSPTPPINRSGLHPGAGYLIGPRVPHGLAAVVEGLTREVLRHRPEDIYVFAAHYFEKLLKLREQYHAEKYNIREFDDDFSREFNLWPTKESGGTKVSPTSDWFLDKEAKVFEKCGKVPIDVEESPEDVSTGREKRKVSKQTCTKSSSSTRKASRRSSKDKDASSDPRATKIISQMSAFRSSSKTILTKDIKQELRKNKLNSGEKGKLSDSVEKGVRGERRSRTKMSKTDKSAEEEIERAATTTAGRTSTRRPLKKVRRIETESETETEREITTKDIIGNGYERTNVKSNSVNREATTACTGSRGRRSEAAAWPSEHSSERKVSSRALSMDRIRAYVLRKFASTASLEVLRSPTYVEQVQEVIDRAAPIIKEKLEEIREPRGKRSRSVDFAWNEESFRRCVAKDKKCGDRDEEEKSRRRNGVSEQKSNDVRREDTSEDQSTNQSEMTSNTESEERRPRRRSVGSGRRSRRRESGGHGDLGIADRVNDDSEQSNKSEHESGAGRDTLEARLTATQSILEGISMSASELNGGRKVDSASDERGEPTASFEASDHVNVVSLPIVRPPSSKSCRNAAKNGSDSLTLPPISPEAPRSTKKKDELSLPILPAAPNGNHSVKKSQEQDGSKDAEEASTMRDITSDMEDIAVLPEDEDRHATASEKQDSMNDHQDARPADEEEGEEDKDAEEALWKDMPRELAGKRISDVSLDRDLEEYRESMKPEEKRVEEIYKDSLNVTPEVVDVPPRPDSLEPDEDKREKLQDDDANGDAMQNNMFDDLKDRLIEIEMAERNIEKALAGQQAGTYNDEAMSDEGKSSVEKMDETRKSNGEAEEVGSEIEKSTSERGIPNGEKKLMSEEKEEEESTNEAEKGSGNVEKLTNGRKISSEERKSMNEEEEEEEEELTNEAEKLSNNVERSMNEREMSDEERKSLNEEEEKEESTNEVEPSIMVANKELIEEKESKAQESTNEAGKVPNGVEDLMVKHHMKNLESANIRYQIKNGQIVQVHGTNGKKNATASNGKTVTENVSSQATGFRNTATADEHLRASLPTDGNNISKTKSRKRRETNEVLATTPLSLKIPFSYVLSEGSPCEIPDSVTTVIIPDRPYPSPVISEIEDRQAELTYLPNEPTTHDEIVEDVSSKDQTRQNEDHAKYGMEVFGEYVRPEVTDLLANVDFVHGARGAKPSQDIVIIHQDLDRIKEEGEEEEEDKEDNERGEEESHLEKKEDGQAVETGVEQAEETAKLKDVTEYKENETNTKTITEEISSSRVPGSEALSKTAESTDLTNAGKMTDVTGEFRSTLDNSSEENGSSQDIHTTTSSEAKESTASNQSIENSSIGRPIVPELNLDSLQDNTISSFKITANGTATKESNGSPRESDATMSLVEPLTPDERLTMGNRLVLADREVETPVEELTLSSPNFPPQSDVPEADQLYPAEHAEYEFLEKDPLSSEALLEDGTEAQKEDVVNLQTSSQDAMHDLISRKKRESEELDSEEEIARELIGLLDKESLCVEETDHEEKPEDHEEPTESNLDVDVEINRPLSDSVHSIVDEVEEEKGDVLSEKSGKLDDENVSKTEAVSKLSGHIADSSQENETEGKMMINKETEEIEEKEHIESNQTTSLAESEQDESSTKDNAITNEETEESTAEVEEKKHLESNQTTSLAESERDESSIKNNAVINEETEEPTAEVKEKKHIESNQVTSLADSEQDESSAKDNVVTNEESEELKEEVEEKKHIESSQVTPLTEFEQDESSVKDDVTTNEEQETEESKEEIEGQKHTEVSQLAPLAEFERDELLEENGSHEIPNEKITAEDEHDGFDDQKNPGDNQDENIPKSQSNKNISEIEEFHEKQEEDKHEEEEEREKSEEDNVEMQECQAKELSDEGKREREESIAQKDNQEHMEVQGTTTSREDSLKKPTEENEDDAEYDETAPSVSVIADEANVDNQKDATSEKGEKTDDLSAKLENVHGPITNAISEQSAQDYYHARYWTMGTKSSTVETVIAAFGSNTSADEKIFGDNFYSTVVKIQACIRGFLARRRLRRDLCSDSAQNGAPLAQKTTVVNNERLLAPEERSSLREGRSGRHRLRREEALRKTTLSLENAFATSRLQHTGEFHDTVPLPLFDMTHSETNSDDLLDESQDREAEEELTKTDTAKSSMREIIDSNCHDDERQGSSQKSNVFAAHSDLPIMMQLLADASRNCHFRINRNDPDLNLGADGAKLMEPALDILMLGYPRDDATLQNRYLNFITSVEDIGANMDYLSPDVATKSATNADDAQPSVTSDEVSVPESLREPLALPGTPQGVVIEELISFDEAAGNVSSMKSESTATKTSLDTNSSMPLEECALEDQKNPESSPRANLADKDNTIDDQKNTMEKVDRESGGTSAVDRNSPSVEEVDLRAEDTSGGSNEIFHNSNGHAGGEENGKT